MDPRRQLPPGRRRRSSLRPGGHGHLSRLLAVDVPVAGDPAGIARPAPRATRPAGGLSRIPRALLPALGLAVPAEESPRRARPPRRSRPEGRCPPPLLARGRAAVP